MKITRAWAMPSSRTFTIKPIRSLILKYKLLKGGLWIDPFANGSRIADITNDLNPEFDTNYHMEAQEFLHIFKDASVDGCLYDPPYSPYQVSECYKGFGKNASWLDTSSNFHTRCKQELKRIIKPGGFVICCGWNSNGIGRKWNFFLEEVLLVAHGGNRNDTIVTVEKRMKNTIRPSLNYGERNGN